MAHLLLQTVLFVAVFGALNCAPSSSPAPLGTHDLNVHHENLASSKVSNEQDKNRHLAGQQSRVARDTPAPGSHDPSHQHDDSSEESKKLKGHDDSSHHLVADVHGAGVGRVARDTPTPAGSQDPGHHHDGSSSEESKESKEHDGSHQHAVGQQDRVARDTATPLSSHDLNHQHGGSSSEESKRSKDSSHQQASGHQGRVTRDSPTTPKPHGEDHDQSHDLHRVTLQKQPPVLHGEQTASKLKRSADHEGTPHEDDHSHSHPGQAVPAVLRKPADNKPEDNVKRTARATEEKHEDKETPSHIQPVAHSAIHSTPLLVPEPLPASRQTRDTNDSSKNTPQQPTPNLQHSDNPQVQHILTVPNHESEYDRHVRDTVKASSTLPDPHYSPVPRPKVGPKSDGHH